MSTYRNGQIPGHLLIRRGDFLLTAGTWAKFDDLVRRVQKRRGVTLRISTGSTVATKGAGAYRTYQMQVLVKQYWTDRGQSRMAAAPGTSSHGGEWKGADALAIDITNYTAIPLAIFFEEARAAGFQVGYFDGRDGRPYEPWHIIDRDPYRHVTNGPALAGESENSMPLDDNDKKWLNGLGGSIIAQLTAAVPPAVWEHLIQAQDDAGRMLSKPDGTPVMWPARGYIGSIAGQIGSTVADVDEAALARQLAPLLSANLSALSDKDVERIAQEAADEIDRRDLKRLSS